MPRAVRSVRSFRRRATCAIAAGVTAVGLGAAIGYQLGHVPTCRYDAQGANGC